MKPENLESIYRLSPAQEGILFHSLYEPEQGLYVMQLAIRLTGSLDGARLKQAWVAVCARHVVLRTSFHWEEMTPPGPGRRKPRDPAVERGRLARTLASRPGTLVRRAAPLRSRTRIRLTEPPLVRLTLVWIAEEVHELIWTFHHLIIDGWSLPLVLREVFSSYAALAECRSAELGPVWPYQDFVGWLRGRDPAASEALWRQVLDGFVAPTPLAVDRTCGLTPSWPRIRRARP